MLYFFWLEPLDARTTPEPDSTGGESKKKTILCFKKCHVLT
jgi:hypothetical protein